MADKNNNGHKSLWLTLAAYAAAVLIGALVASIWWHYHGINTIKNISAQVKPLRQANNPYQYINPLLGYEVPGDVKEFSEYKPLGDQINKAVSQNNSQNLSAFSVYFRDLTLGRWMGINENAAYEPGSMMKVVVMIAYYKEAETDPSVLQKQFVYSSSTADQINGVPLSSPSDLQVGKGYTVDQLIRAMIVNSDNGAKQVLLDNLDQKSFIEIHTDLGLPNPAQSQNYTISAKQYSVLLRVLYNATYLSRTYSEKALEILAQAKYAPGLVAGVPAETAVAQKYGEAFDQSNPSQPQITLSNCGVIYHPTHPYILCVMTKGGNLDDLNKAVAAISSVTWKAVNAYALNKNY